MNAQLPALYRPGNYFLCGASLQAVPINTRTRLLALPLRRPDHDLLFFNLGIGSQQDQNFILWEIVNGATTILAERLHTATGHGANALAWRRCRGLGQLEVFVTTELAVAVTTISFHLEGFYVPRA